MAVLAVPALAVAQETPVEPDLDSIAMRIVQQSLVVQPGEVVSITGGPTEIKFMAALQVAVAKAGGQPLLQLNIPEANKRALLETPLQHLERLPTAGLLVWRISDAIINLGSVQDPDLFADVPEERLAATRRAGAPLNDAFRTARFRSVGLGQTGGIPSEAYAESQGADYEEMMNTFWAALDVAPDELAASADRLAALLTEGGEVHLTSSAGTDLRFTVDRFPARINAGRTTDVVKASGPAQVWLPAGEAYVCVKGMSASGTLVVPHMTFRGVAVENLQLEFEGGRVTNLSAEANGEMVRDYLDASSPNSKQLSVLDIGVNPHSRPLAGSHYLSWEMGGMVTLGIGNNSWAGGDNDADAGLSFHIAGATLTIGDKTVVRDGQLQSEAGVR
jgi:leucyl aminopeptidase (aminopeptidase T)